MTETEKFREWIDKEAIVEIVFETLQDLEEYKTISKGEANFESAKLIWLEVLEYIGENIEDFAYDCLLRQKEKK